MFLNFKKFSYMKCGFSILDHWPDCKTKKITVEESYFF